MEIGIIKSIVLDTGCQRSYFFESVLKKLKSKNYFSTPTEYKDLLVF